jgi:hypothetical protein
MKKSQRVSEETSLLLKSFKNISEIRLEDSVANNTEKEIHHKFSKQPTVSDQSSDVH